MTDAKAPEPSIEEILASIRKIISDDEPDDAASTPIPIAVESEKPEEEDDEVLELTEVVMETTDTAAAEPIVMTDQPTHDPSPEPHSPEPPDEGEESILSEATMAVATGAFAKLSHTDSHNASTPTARGQTVEDIARDLLRPILRQWIDQNLPGIVERLVERELRKISRKAEDL